MDNKQIPDDYRNRHYPVKENMRFQLFAWKMQKVGFLLLFLFIAAACLGLFSQGVLSNASTQSASGNMRLEYDRFARNSTDTNFIIRVKINKENQLTTVFRGDLLDNYDIEFIQPLPDTSFISDKALTLTQPISKKDTWYSIYMTLKPNKMGYFTNTITLSDNEKITFNQLVYP
ncbi:hypothetical protein [Acerihabitans arboris]|uniref:Uncharacterized protein n=1 Tax=Acerihabitans arboris TaxID=2691583 RepID=A0A845SL88_9GAMM|nr:hypothetical protein [Acerihabitans arboris]NDL64007.1 hypothetical protein [Acerihabitans arboris]